MRYLSTFAGIGGMDLGLDRAGWECAGQVEIDPFCRKVLAKHWPNVPRFEDVRSVTGELIRERCGRIDAVVGGPPCQPASLAGQRRGAADDRWLWPEYLRLVSEIDPLFLLAENPRGVLSLKIEGLEFGVWLAREFQSRGYELLPIELAAEDLGAPHRRERIWFVGYALRGRRRVAESRRSREVTEAGCDDLANAGSRGQQVACYTEDLGGVGRETQSAGNEQTEEPEGFCGMADAKGRSASRLPIRETEEVPQSGINDEELADADIEREQQQKGRIKKQRRRVKNGRGGIMADANGARSQEYSCEPGNHDEELPPTIGSCWGWPSRPGEQQRDWEEPRVITVESQMGSAIDGVSIGLVRRHRNAALKGLGNAVVPQCAEVLGRMILDL